MKDLHKNPILYYILAPILVGIWPLLVWAAYLPGAKDALGDDLAFARKGQAMALSILALDPERADTVDANDTGVEFSYAEAVYKVARICDIPASKYKLNTKQITTKDKQMSQSAHLRSEEIGVVQLARFLSLIQYKWGTLQGDEATLNEVKSAVQRDVWTVELDFIYYY